MIAVHGSGQETSGRRSNGRERHLARARQKNQATAMIEMPERKSGGKVEMTTEHLREETEIMTVIGTTGDLLPQIQG